MFKIISRLPAISWSQNSVTSVAKNISTDSPLQFKSTPFLLALPLKPKKKFDPNIIRAREERKRKKIEKQIKQLKKIDKQLKPITEKEIPYVLIDEIDQRVRKVDVPQEIVQERTKLLKKWTIFKNNEARKDQKMFNRIIESQQKALNELRAESEELYQAAVQIDYNLMSFKYSGPVETPSQESYLSPDGAYIDVSRKWK